MRITKNYPSSNGLCETAHTTEPGSKLSLGVPMRNHDCHWPFNGPGEPASHQVLYSPLSLRTTKRYKWLESCCTAVTTEPLGTVSVASPIGNQDCQPPVNGPGEVASQRAL